MQLTLDTSWWTRYRSDAHNPDLDRGFTFPQAVPGLSAGKFTAIPRTKADLVPDAHIQANRQHRSVPHAHHRTGREQPLPIHAQRASSVEVSNVGRQGGRRGFSAAGPAQRSDERLDLSRPEFAVWREDVHDEPDHVRALSVPQSKAPEVLDHSSHRDAACGNGRAVIAVSLLSLVVSVGPMLIRIRRIIYGDTERCGVAGLSERAELTAARSYCLSQTVTLLVG
jgi:hypothetical protein